MTFWDSVKAFTLFTALVSFVIIGIGVIVIQHISNSEQNYTTIINSLARQQEMDSAKDLIRIDSLVVFNLLYRAKVYSYFNTDSTGNRYYNSVDDISDNDKKNLNQDFGEFKKLYLNEMYFGSGS